MAVLNVHHGWVEAVRQVLELFRQLRLDCAGSLGQSERYKAAQAESGNRVMLAQALLDQASDVKLEQMLAERSLVEEGESREEQVAKLEVQLAEEWALLDGMATMT